jgi:hypothetical protein
LFETAQPYTLLSNSVKRRIYLVALRPQHPDELMKPTLTHIFKQILKARMHLTSANGEFLGCHTIAQPQAGLKYAALLRRNGRYEDHIRTQGQPSVAYASVYVPIPDFPVEGQLYFLLMPAMVILSVNPAFEDDHINVCAHMALSP